MRPSTTFESNCGIGVWKVELAAADRVDPAETSPASAETMVRVQHARPRDTATEEMRLVDFIARCEDYFSGDGRMADQPFQPRIAEGMIRAYMVKDEVVGFAHQWPEGLSPEDASDGRAAAASHNILGLPAKKTMYPATEPGSARCALGWNPGGSRGCSGSSR